LFQLWFVRVSSLITWKTHLLEIFNQIFSSGLDEAADEVEEEDTVINEENAGAGEDVQATAEVRIKYSIKKYIFQFNF
jgi:hypothetical protein